MVILTEVIKLKIDNIDRIDIKDIEGNNNIVFDTNFLFVTFLYDIDIIRELEKNFGINYSLYIFEGTLSELEKVNQKKDKKRKKSLPLVRKFLELYNFKIINSSNTYVDSDFIQNHDKGLIFATSDKALKKKLREKSAKVLFLRQKSYLELE